MAPRDFSPTLQLPLAYTGPVQGQQAFKDAMQKIDAAFADLPSGAATTATDVSVVTTEGTGLTGEDLQDVLENIATSVAADTPATDVTVAADVPSGLTTGDLQTVLVALAARVKALETAV